MRCTASHIIPISRSELPLARSTHVGKRVTSCIIAARCPAYFAAMSLKLGPIFVWSKAWQIMQPLLCASWAPSWRGSARRLPVDLFAPVARNFFTWGVNALAIRADACVAVVQSTLSRTAAAPAGWSTPIATAAIAGGLLFSASSPRENPRAPDPILRRCGTNDAQNPRAGAGVGVQTPPLREWTHAAPVILLSAIPPAMVVLPSADIATEKPCSARPTAPVPTSFMPCWLHTVPRRLKTHAAPVYELS